MKLLSQSRTLVGLAATVLLVASFTATTGATEVAAKDNPREAKLFFGGLYSTITRISVILTTTGTRYYTCISAIANTMTCTGRRRRRNVLPTLNAEALLEDQQNHAVPIYSSLKSEAEPQVLTNSAVRDPKKLFLTLFTTTTSRTTFSTFFSDTGTTISLSVGCFDPSFSFPPTC